MGGLLVKKPLQTVASEAKGDHLRRVFGAVGFDRPGDRRDHRRGHLRADRRGGARQGRARR